MSYIYFVNYCYSGGCSPYSVGSNYLNFSRAVFTSQHTSYHTAHPRVLVKRRERKYKNKEKLLVSTSLIPPLVPQWSPLQIWPSRYPNTFQPPACPSLAEVSCPRSSPPTKRCFLPCSVTPLVWPPGYSSEEEEKEGRMTLHP